MTLEAGLRLNNEPDLLPEDEIVVYKLSAEERLQRQTTLKVSLPTDRVIHFLDVVVFTDAPVSTKKAGKAEITFGLKDQSECSVALSHLRTTILEATEGPKGRPEWSFRIYRE